MVVLPSTCLSVGLGRGWKWDKHRQFSTKSAYARCSPPVEHAVGSIWSLLASYKGLPRVKSLLWLICKNKLLSNEERARRHMANHSACSICGATVESVSHIFRDCVIARAVWGNLIKTGCLMNSIGWNWCRGSRRIFAPLLFFNDFTPMDNVLQECWRMYWSTERMYDSKAHTVVSSSARVDRNETGNCLLMVSTS
ncbi:hypothetical protein F3Y22_tig00110560pilonHSYRG00091 [Hibiscus syriacus]|uniref:Reverse transcriptase zinc-binding domain-containing protein n=1 Tax=Hibiscus syriacus TaxID=106335 RepID=A0A6A3A8H6_HIBSY|nr:hypothetical protein F3Y22_tig00110560pilonHSYRG00091 [Hibiscus syriacus]